MGLKFLLLTLPQAWTPTGPYGGYVVDVAVDDAEVVYAYTSQGIFRKASSVWVRLDKGPLPFADQATGLNEVAHVGDNLWICTEDAGLWKYNDFDETWEQGVGVPEQADVIDVVLYNGLIIAATRNSGLYASEDTGDSFIPYDNESLGIPNGAVIQSIASGLYEDLSYEYLAVVVEDPYQIHMESNQGEFNILPVASHLPLYVTCSEWAFTNPDAGGIYLYLGTGGGAVFVQNPFSASPIWLMNMRPADDILIFDLAAHQGHVAAATYAGVFWTPIGSNDNWPHEDSGPPSPFVNDFDTGEALFCATSDGIWFNSSPGEAWNPVPELPAQYFTSIEVATDDPFARVATTLGGGLFYRGQGDGNWHRTGIHIVPFALDAAVGGLGGADTMYFLGGIGAIAASHNLDSWAPVHSLTNENNEPHIVQKVVGAQDHTRKVWFAVAENVVGEEEAVFVIYFSSDGLGSYNESKSLGIDSLCDMAYSTDMDYLFVANSEGVWRSENPSVANTLELVASPGDGPLQQIRLAGDRLYVLTYLTGSVYSSDDWGDSWEPVSTPQGSPVQYIATDPDNGDFLMVAGWFDSGHGVTPVWATSDGGQSWDEGLDEVPGTIQALDAAYQGTRAYTHAATAQGVFSDDFEIHGEPAGEDTLHFEIEPTPESRLFHPELAENAEFELRGTDTLPITFWEFTILDSYNEFIHTETGEGSAPHKLVWDGLDDGGWIVEEGSFRAMFYAETDNGFGSDTSDAYVEVVIGRPPRSTRVEATKGTRLLYQYDDPAETGYLLYFSREPQAGLFGVEYNTLTARTEYGEPLSEYNLVVSQLASTDITSEGLSWVSWTEDGSTLYATSDYRWSAYEVSQIPATEKFRHAQVVVSNDDYVLVTAVSDDGGSSNIGTIFIYEEPTDTFIVDDPQFNSDPTQMILDMETVAASDGVHIICLIDEGYITDLVWTEPGMGVTADDLGIIGVREFSATSYGEDIVYLVYIDDTGNIYFTEHSPAGWSEPEMVDRGAGAPPNPRNLTSNINSSDVFTVAWETDGGLIYFVQRSGSTWGTPDIQASGNSHFPILPARTYSSTQPLIAWTHEDDGDIDPYNDVFITQLGGEPPTPEDSFDITIHAPSSVLLGEPIEIAVTTNESANFMDLLLVFIDTGDEFWTDDRWPSPDSSGYDSLHVYYESTENFLEGEYLVKVYAESMLGELDSVFDTLTISTIEDTTIIVDPERVFFVPNPAVQQQTARVYYDLNWTAEISLYLFNARGKRIMEYDAGEVSAGIQNYIEIDISGLGSDVYFFYFIADATNNAEFDAVRSEAESLDIKIPDNYIVVRKPFVVVR